MKTGKLAIQPWLVCQYNEHMLVDFPSSVISHQKQQRTFCPQINLPICAKRIGCHYMPVNLVAPAYTHASMSTKYLCTSTWHIYQGGQCCGGSQRSINTRRAQVFRSHFFHLHIYSFIQAFIVLIDRHDPPQHWPP